MDIKDFILIGGGLLIAAVIVHGFWIAWRARRDPLRIDLVSDLQDPDPSDDDELVRLRAELPNGGARLVGSGDPPWQGALDLDRSAGAEGAADTPATPADRGETGGSTRARPALRQRGKTEPRLGPTAGSAAPAIAPEQREPLPPPPERPARSREDRRATPRKAEESSRWSGRKPAADGRGGQRTVARPSRGAGQDPAEPRKAEQPVEELIMLSVVAPKGRPFVGGGLVEALRARGLRYGDMNIFHRVDPTTRATLYSVANVVEPGTFDVADLDDFRSPGVCFFMQLPGPEHPLDAFEDMLKVARDVATRVGGELKDEQRSVMTGQTVEHYRQRISDFCRRRMSMRA